LTTSHLCEVESMVPFARARRLRVTVTASYSREKQDRNDTPVLPAKRVYYTDRRSAQVYTMTAQTAGSGSLTIGGD